MKTGLILGAAFAASVAVSFGYEAAMLSHMSENTRNQLSGALPDGTVVSIYPEQKNVATFIDFKKDGQTQKVMLHKGLPAGYFADMPSVQPYVAQNYNAAAAKVCDLLNNYQTPAPKLWVSKGVQDYMADLGRAAQATYKRECV